MCVLLLLFKERQCWAGSEPVTSNVADESDMDVQGDLDYNEFAGSSDDLEEEEASAIPQVTHLVDKDDFESCSCFSHI